MDDKPAVAHQLLVLLALLACHASSPAFAADYYVDASKGNDDWSGNFAEPQPGGCIGVACTDGPWRGLTPVNLGGFVAGDRVYLHCEQIWRDTLSVINSGTSDNPISISSYGGNCATSPPKISGSDIVQDWSADIGQSNVYVADVSATVKQVFVDGQTLKLAQYPDSGFLSIDTNSGTVLSPGCIERIAGRPGNCFLQDAGLSGLTDLTGAGIHIRTINWSIEHRKVVDFDSLTNTVFWDIESDHEIKKDYGYYLDNKRWMLDTPGEWYHDPVQEKLYVWLPDSSDPGLHTVEASIREYGLDARNVSHIELSKLDFSQAAQDGLYLYSVNAILLDSLAVTDSGNNGAYVGSGLSVIFSNSLIERSLHDGIRLVGSPGTSILNNTVIDSGTIGSPKNCLAAIDGISSDNMTIEGNTITNAGYTGIRFKRNSIIRNNIINNTCLVLDDCAAIYTWAKSDPAPVPAYNSIVDGNIIVDVIGNAEGRPPGKTLAVGIYLDDLSSGITATNNTVVNADRGIFLHNSSDNVINNNTLFDNRKYELGMLESTAAGDLSANSIDENILFPLSYRETVNLSSSFNHNAFASYNNNVYALLHYDWITTERYVPAGTVSTQFDFPAWQAEHDSAAQAIAPFAQAQGLLDPEAPANLISNSDFTNGTAGWTFWPSNSSLALQADCGWGGACISFRASVNPVDSLLISNPLSLVQGNSYVVEFAARGEYNNQTLNTIVRRRESNPPNYEAVGLNKALSLSTEWSHHRLTFTATKTLSTARLEINTPAGEAVELDDVRMLQVIENDPADDARILINDKPVSQSFPCPHIGTPEELRCDQYIGINGAPVSWPVTVAAFGSNIIIWSGNPFQDSDFDTLADTDDNCPNDSNSAQRDLDLDNHGDVCDAFPANAAEWLDTDNDGIGNNNDSDDDGDGLLDVHETHTGVYVSPVDTGTDPLASDTDGDIVNDGLEVAAGTDPLLNASTPVLHDGDANNDGQVNAADLVIATRILLGLMTATPLQQAKLDVAPLIAGTPVADGQFNAGDYAVLVRKISGAISF